MFAKETYISRRARLKKDMGKGLLLFLGNGEAPMNYLDNTYTFRQDSSFLYFFGLSYASLAAVIDIDEDREIIFGNDLTIDDIVWQGTQPTLSEKSARVGVSDTLPMGSLAEYISRARAKGQKIHFLDPYRGEHKVWLHELLGLETAQISSSASVEFAKAIVAQRNHKTEEELASIEKAVDISTRMHLQAYRMVKPGMHEAEVAAAILKIANEAEDTLLSFPTIATTHGHVLHNHGFHHVAKEGDLFLVDAGAESPEHYAGDLSSTMPVGERFTQRQEQIYNIHLASFQAALDNLKIGVPFREAHLAAATAIVEVMKELGLMKGNARDAAEAGAYAIFFPCGLGHMMGLDVHDMENLGEQYVGYEEGNVKSKQFGFKSLRLARPLEPGFVFTVEPGIYFMPELIDKWHAEKQFTDFINYDRIEDWKGFTGLRNELDYVMTENGPRLLGTIKKPMTIEEVLDAKNRN